MHSIASLNTFTNMRGSQNAGMPYNTLARESIFLKNLPQFRTDKCHHRVYLHQRLR